MRHVTLPSQGDLAVSLQVVATWNEDHSGWRLHLAVVGPQVAAGYQIDYQPARSTPWSGATLRHEFGDDADQAPCIFSPCGYCRPSVGIEENPLRSEADVAPLERLITSSGAWYASLAEGSPPSFGPWAALRESIAPVFETDEGHLAATLCTP